MAGPTGHGWPTPPRWWDELLNWRERRRERRAGDPVRRLELAETRLSACLSRRGPGSWRTVNAMEAVAKYREALGRTAEALPLREQVVRGRREELGPEHPLTLAAEARLAVALLELDRPDRAKDLLRHVRHGLSAAHGPDDLTVLAVTERLADAELALGDVADARRHLEEAVDRYDGRGDEVSGASAAVRLARGLIGVGEYADASDLLRRAVEVRARVLGVDDPETLTTLRSLVSALVWSNEYAEASIVARNLLAATLRTQGPEADATLDAQRLVQDIDDRLGGW